MGYLDQDGILLGTTLQRATLGANYEQHLFDDRLRLRSNVRASRQHDVFTPGGVLANAAQMGPTQPVYDSTSAPGYYNWPGATLTSADNPLRIAAGTIDLTGGYSYQTEDGEYPYFQATYLPSSASIDRIILVPDSSQVTNTLFIEDYKLISFFGRANYNLNDRYLAAVTLRRDGS